MKILVVSPHCDDAAFSLCEHILTWVEDGHDVEIFTVFGGMPEDPAGRNKHRTLRREHAGVVAELGVTASSAQWLDDVYDTHRPNMHALRGTLAEAAEGFDVLVRPEGILHPDHMKVGGACDWSVEALPRQLIYDEIPYYVRQPWDVYDRHGIVSFPCSPTGCRSNLNRKKEICMQYASQINEDLLRCLWVPERCWGTL